MDRLEQYSRKIATYIYEDMEPEDRALFEAELERNGELAEEYSRQVHVVKYLKARTQVNAYLQDPDLKEADRLVEEYFKGKDDAESSSENVQSTPSRSRSLKQILYPLAAAAAIAGGVLILNTFISGGLNDRLFERYYTPMDDASLVQRGGERAYTMDFEKALNLYFTGDYTNSALEFSNLARRNPEHAESALFLSLSKLGAGNYEEAAGLLESYLNHFDTYRPEAEWYLALCYLKLDQPERSVELLADLTRMGGKLGTDSKRIVQRFK